MRILIFAMFMACVAAFLNSSIPIPAAQPMHKNDIQAPAKQVTLVARAVWDPNRMADPRLWNKVVAQGRGFACLLKMSDAEAGRALGRSSGSVSSPWNNGNMEGNVATWGWRWQDFGFQLREWCSFGQGERNRKLHVWRMFRDLNMRTGNDHHKRGANRCYYVMHSGETGVLLSCNGRPCTNAFYRFGVNTKDEIIIFMEWSLPADAARGFWDTPPTKATLPALGAPWHLAAAKWIERAPFPTFLKYILFTDIVNDDARQVIARVLYMRDPNHTFFHNRVPYWDGAKFFQDTPEWKALLGTLPGDVVSHLLIEYKSLFGVKSVGTITVFRDDREETSDPKICLLFELYHVMPHAAGSGTVNSLQDRHVELSKSKNVVRTHYL